MQYVAQQLRMLRGDDDKLQLRAAKELANISTDVPATGISAGTLGALYVYVYVLFTLVDRWSSYEHVQRRSRVYCD